MTETLREIAKEWRNYGKEIHADSPRTGDAFLECSERIEKLLSEAECDLVKLDRAKASEIREILERKKAERTITMDFAIRQEERVLELEGRAYELETWLAVNLPRIKAEARLDEAKSAPHDENCLRYSFTGDISNPPCDCWKATRIAELSAQSKGAGQ